MGQGARTIFAQIAAEELGAPLDWVTVVMGDTAVVPYDQQTSASRSSVLMGNAVLRACRDIQAKLRAMAPARGRRRGDVVVDGGEVRIGDRELPSGTSSLGLGRLGGEVIGVGEMRKEAEPDHPLGGTAAFYEFNCHRGRGRASTETTGDITIHRHVTVSDVGKALNPAAGPRPGRGRRDHGPRPHADGALHPRRRPAGSGTSARSTTGSRRRMDLPLRMESDIDRERATGPGRTARRA